MWKDMLSMVTEYFKSHARPREEKTLRKRKMLLRMHATAFSVAEDIMVSLSLLCFSAFLFY